MEIIENVEVILNKKETRTIQNLLGHMSTNDMLKHVSDSEETVLVKIYRQLDKHFGDIKDE